MSQKRKQKPKQLLILKYQILSGLLKTTIYKATIYKSKTDLNKHVKQQQKINKIVYKYTRLINKK